MFCGAFISLIKKRVVQISLRLTQKCLVFESKRFYSVQDFLNFHKNLAGLSINQRLAF